MNHRIAKLLYVNNRSEDDDQAFEKRDLWRDKRLVIVDAAGVTFRLKSWWWNEAPIKLEHDKCIDVVTDSHLHYAKYLMDDCSFKYRSLAYSDQKATDLSDDFDWSGLLTKVAPKPIAYEEGWMNTDSVRDFMMGFQRYTGKNCSELLLKLSEEEISRVDDFQYFSDFDYKELGFTVNLKLKMKQLLKTREGC